MKAQRAGTLPLILFFLAACGGEGPRGALVESRDSARVLIVENRHTLDDLPLFVILDPEPLLKLGVADGDPQRRFGEVHFAARLGEDRILVADGQARELHIFDLQGNHLATAGRPGDGPGAFHAFGALAVTAGDSIRILDPRNRRITILGPQGEMSSHTLLGPATARRISA